jgi:hypothetical protein
MREVLKRENTNKYWNGIERRKLDGGVVVLASVCEALGC